MNPRDRDSVFQNRAQQVLTHLRERLVSGSWGGRLPPERELAAQLRVSRWTLRAAIKELQQEGFIGRRSQAGTAITLSDEPAHPRTLSIGIVFSSRTDFSSGRILTLLENIRHYLIARNARLEVHKTLYPHGGGISAHFKRLMQTTPHDGWALVAPTSRMQQWCAEEGLPVMLVGSRDTALSLPQAGVDHRALCRHAVGEMFRHGHRRVALILPREEKSEDRESRIGFEEAIKDSPHREAHGLIEIHDQSQAGICRLADRLLQSEPRPSAWLVARQGIFTTLYTYLLGLGIRFPGQLSILSRDSDVFLTDMVPKPTHYAFDRGLMARRCARLALRVAAGQARPKERVRMIPEFIPGSTLGPCPE